MNAQSNALKTSKSRLAFKSGKDDDRKSVLWTVSGTEPSDIYNVFTGYKNDQYYKYLDILLRHKDCVILNVK